MADNPDGKPKRLSGFECLPGSVITDNILLRLPLPEAVRTSLLSRAWRHRWESMPRLDFSLRSFPRRSHEKDGTHAGRVVRTVDRALLLRTGPLQEFILSGVLHGCPHVDSWIRVLSRTDVKRIVLDFPEGGDAYRLSLCIFDCGALMDLTLSCCLLRLPHTYRGFKGLTTLVLQLIGCTVDGLERLISNCPLLKDLTLDFVDCDEFRIYAPNLCRLVIVDTCKRLILQNMPLLEYAKFHLAITGFRVSDDTINLVRLCTLLPCVRELDLGALCIELFLSIGDIPARLPVPLWHLRAISMTIRLRNLRNTMVALCLLKSCPALEILEICQYVIKEVPFKISNFWDEKNLGCNFDHLRIVILTGISNEDTEMAFVKFILANAPILQKLCIRLTKDVSEDAFKFKMVAEVLLSLPRASKQARIFLQN